MSRQFSLVSCGTHDALLTRDGALLQRRIKRPYPQLDFVHQRVYAFGDQHGHKLLRDALLQSLVDRDESLSSAPPLRTARAELRLER